MYIFHYIANVFDRNWSDAIDNGFLASYLHNSRKIVCVYVCIFVLLYQSQFSFNLNEAIQSSNLKVKPYLENDWIRKFAQNAQHIITSVLCFVGRWYLITATILTSTSVINSLQSKCYQKIICPVCKSMQYTYLRQ